MCRKKRLNVLLTSFRRRRRRQAYTYIKIYYAKQQKINSRAYNQERVSEDYCEERCVHVWMCIYMYIYVYQHRSCISPYNTHAAQKLGRLWQDHHPTILVAPYFMEYQYLLSCCCRCCLWLHCHWSNNSCTSHCIVLFPMLPPTFCLFGPPLFCPLFLCALCFWFFLYSRLKSCKLTRTHREVNSKRSPKFTSITNGIYVPTHTHIQVYTSGAVKTMSAVRVMLPHHRIFAFHAFFGSVVYFFRQHAPIKYMSICVCIHICIKKCVFFHYSMCDTVNYGFVASCASSIIPSFCFCSWFVYFWPHFTPFLSSLPLGGHYLLLPLVYPNTLSAFSTLLCVSLLLL